MSIKVSKPQTLLLGYLSDWQILVPWAVFAVALALKVLKFGSALKRHLTAPTPSTDQFRQSLERIWAQEQRE